MLLPRQSLLPLLKTNKTATPSSPFHSPFQKTLYWFFFFFKRNPAIGIFLLCLLESIVSFSLKMIYGGLFVENTHTRMPNPIPILIVNHDISMACFIPPGVVIFLLSCRTHLFPLTIFSDGALYHSYEDRRFGRPSSD